MQPNPRDLSPQPIFGSRLRSRIVIIVVLVCVFSMCRFEPEMPEEAKEEARCSMCRFEPEIPEEAKEEARGL